MNDLARLDVTPDWRPTKKVKDRLPLRVKPKPAAAGSVREAQAAWYAAVMSKRNSVVWTAEDYPVIAAGATPKLHAHHAISAQELRKHGLGPWDDPRNGFPVSARRHERHHSRVEPLSRAELPDEVYAYVAEHPELKPYFERTYKPEGGRAARAQEVQT